jgi:hypothetical protein
MGPIGVTMNYMDLAEIDDSGPDYHYSTTIASKPLLIREG